MHPHMLVWQSIWQIFYLWVKFSDLNLSRAQHIEQSSFCSSDFPLLLCYKLVVMQCSYSSLWYRFSLNQRGSQRRRCSWWGQRPTSMYSKTSIIWETLYFRSLFDFYEFYMWISPKYLKLKSVNITWTNSNKVHSFCGIVIS